MNSNSSNPPQLPDKLAGFDLEDGLQRMQGNQALYIKLIGKFASGFSTAGAEISQALADGDLEQTHALVHNLKGLAGNLSATRLFEAARTLDEAIKSNLDRATIEADLTTLNDALTEVLASAATVHPADSS